MLGESSRGTAGAWPLRGDGSCDGGRATGKSSSRRWHGSQLQRSLHGRLAAQLLLSIGSTLAPLCPSPCSSSLHGNPHSEAGWGESRSAVADAARLATLRMCNADPEQYVCIFTAGATGALQAVHAMQERHGTHAGQCSVAWHHKMTGHHSRRNDRRLIFQPSCPLCPSLTRRYDQFLVWRTHLPVTWSRHPSPAAALKLVGESFPWRPASTFLYLRDNHNSVLGIRQLAAQHGAACSAAVELQSAGGGCGGGTEGCEWQLTPCSEAAAAGLEAAAAASTADGFSAASLAEHLFAFPMESNFSGARYDPGLVAAVQSGRLRYSSAVGSDPNPRSNATAAAAGADGHASEGVPLPAGRWRVVLDCAKACGTAPPDLAACPADFAVLSYYKIFGYPTGKSQRGGLAVMRAG